MSRNDADSAGADIDTDEDADADADADARPGAGADADAAGDGPRRDPESGGRGPTAGSDAGAGTAAPEVDVPATASTHVCDDCGQPFPEGEYLTLHRGLVHYERLDEEEREAFAEAYEREGADIRRFRLVALGVLVLLYFGFLFLYAGFA
jgi:hypothetical protein